MVEETTLSEMRWRDIDIRTITRRAGVPYSGTVAANDLGNNQS